jgi:hypothetical protein
MIKNVLLAGCILWAVVAQGQELNCTVAVNATQIQTNDRTVFADMKKAIEQFMNTRKWTNDTYKSHERIACNILITVSKMNSPTNFEASVQIQSARPVYNSNYSSLVFNFADRDWQFEYVESQPMEYNDNTYTTNLTSMLATYAYLILGVDYDTFSELGGTPFFQQARQVVNNAQQSGREGWTGVSGNNRNRYWVVDGFNNPQMTDLRKTYYAYHRLALDTFDKDPDKSREIILKGLKDIKKVRDLNPTAVLLVSFFDAKAKELVNIFSSGNLPVRREAHDVIQTLDPSSTRANYGKIIQN